MSMSIRSLGYDTQLQHESNKEPEEVVESSEEAMEEEEEDGPQYSNQSINNIPGLSRLPELPPAIKSLFGSAKLLQAAMFQDGKWIPAEGGMSGLPMLTSPADGAS